MKVWTGIVLSMVLGLGGCSKEPREVASNATGIESPAAMQAPVPKVLLPTYAATGHCLSTCVSQWWRLASEVPQDLVAKFKPEMPLTFAALLASPSEQERFLRLVEQFPGHLHPIGILQPGDEEKLVASTFGSYKKEKPKMFGDLANVINNNGRVVYLYSGVHYYRLENEVSGTMHVAIDPKTHEYAGLIRGGKDLDEYYIAGAESLRSTLLAFTVADDLGVAEMLAHYQKKGIRNVVLK